MYMFKKKNAVASYIEHIQQVSVLAWQFIVMKVIASTAVQFLTQD